jgi:signal transduction histidine kinase
MSTRPPAWKKRSAGLLTLLVVSLAAAGALAWEAARAAGGERATAEAVLRDYAGFAAWQYARAARQQVDGAIERVLASLCSAERRDGVTRVLARRADLANGDCGCPAPPPEVRSFFHVTATGEWLIAGDDVPAATRAVVRGETIERRMQSAAHLRVVDLATGPALLVWRDDREHREPVTHGFVSSLAIVKPALRAAEKNAPLLPPALVERAGNRAVLAIAVRDGRGRLLNEAPPWQSPYARAAPMDARFGGLTVTAALDPDAAGSLVIGGLPRSRLPFIYGLVALGALLIGLGVVQVRRALELARLHGDFVSGVSHELRTPLAQIRMFAETLALGRVRSAEESKRSIEIILQESQRLSQLVDNVLCFSRVERDMVAMHGERVRVRRLIEELVEGLRPLARARHATLRVAMDSEIPAVLDTGAVRQILVNLIDNALKYGPSGQAVTVSAVRRGVALRIAVDDEGPGVAAAEVERIWTPFWRGPDSAQGGSGIGLAIVRDLVLRHSGAVHVETAPSGGARFVVELHDLPLREASGNRRDAGSAKTAKHGTSDAA